MAIVVDCFTLQSRHKQEFATDTVHHLLFLRDDELCHVVSAHAIDRSSGTRSYGIGIAAGMLGGYRDGPISTAHDGARMIKGIGIAEIKDEARILRGTGKGHGGSRFDAKSLVGLGTGNIWGSGSRGSPTAAYVDGARGRSGTAGVLTGTNARRV